MLLIQSQMPCSFNFNRYKTNFAKFVQENGEEDKPKTAKEVQLICSPTMIRTMSPISRMQLDDFNLNPLTQARLLQNVAKAGKGGERSDKYSHTELNLENSAGMVR
jgi:hypothetical protein